MTEFSTEHPNAARVLEHKDDSRPAWLWSADGQSLLWYNGAAELFLAKIKKSGLKRTAMAVPIKGQVQRIIRLGGIGRSSLARIQFLAGDKPASSTCTTTPLEWINGEIALLIVGVDAIGDEVWQAAFGSNSVGNEQIAEEAAPETTDDTASPALGVAAESEAWVEVTEDIAPAVADTFAANAAPELAAGADQSHAEAEPDRSYQRELESWQDVDAETVYAPAPIQDLDPAIDEPSHWQQALDDEAAEPQLALDGEDTGSAPKIARRLSDLVAKLSEGDGLYAPLGQKDDLPPAVGATSATEAPAEVIRLFDAADEARAEQEALDAATEAEAEAEESPSHVEEEAAEPTPLFKITGRGFVADAHEDEAPIAPASIAEITAEDTITLFKVRGRGFVSEVLPKDQATEDASDHTGDESEPALPPLPDSGALERVSRYNFDELSRILNDRVGLTTSESKQRTPAQREAAAGASGSLINLGGETLVLNRLPLGILVFRDQQILFANRAISEMVGFDTVDNLRKAGLSALFPAEGPDGQQAGPINHLVQRDGTLVPVTARLQSISWQGRPALMLSASSTEVRTGHEDAVRAFARNFADLRGDGYIESNRSGVISDVSDNANALLTTGKALVGRTVASLLGEEDNISLRHFLERPARFAETARPCVMLRTKDGKADLLLFALGQAGIVSGYFGFVRARETGAVRVNGDVDSALLGRISRGVRRPLNTIIGFSDVIRTKAFGELDNERYVGYADDIARAGQEIAALVDELDDYARLRDGRYMPQRATLDLTTLLESCVVRIRDQANSARVIVRNAISEKLPRISADRASLAQAVLNLLASAIDQTPAGGAVVISAHRQDENGITIQVRDSSARSVDMAERFVVFRDGLDRDGKVLAPVRSSVGLALTRSLLAVNAISLNVDPAGQDGMLFSLKIAAELIDDRPLAKDS